MRSPCNTRATKRRRSSVTELAFHGINTSGTQLRAGGVPDVSCAMRHRCLGSDKPCATMAMPRLWDCTPIGRRRSRLSHFTSCRHRLPQAQDAVVPGRGVSVAPPDLEASATNKLSETARQTPWPSSVVSHDEPDSAVLEIPSQVSHEDEDLLAGLGDGASRREPHEKQWLQPTVDASIQNSNCQ